jgi:2-methylcitrate dehydratase PrpD
MIAPYSEPIDSYRAKFCPPYVVAAALVDRQVGLRQFTSERIGNPDILALMRRVTIRDRNDIREDQGWCNGEDNWCAVRIGVRLKNGKVLNEHFSQAKGWPARPASWADLCGKYEECADGILPPAQVRESIAMIRDLTELRSVRSLMRLLAKPA